MGCLQGKKVVLSGGGQGIGLAIAREIIARGADLVVSYYSSRSNAEMLISEAKAKGLRAEAIQADLTDEKSAANFIAKAAEFLGGIDCLINNVGDLVGRKTLGEIDLDFYTRVFDVNLKSMLLLSRQALPHLQKNSEGASIVNLSSLAGRKGGHGGSLVYSTAKGAVLTWTRALAAELGPYGIRVNALAPGLILGTSFHSTHTTTESAQNTIAGIPLGRAGTPEDVARAAAFLASEYDGFITGATIDINGGVYCA